MFVRKFLKEVCGKLLLRSFPHKILRFFFNSIFTSRANHNNRAFSFWYAQDGFAFFALEIEVCFAVAPHIAAEFKEIQKSVFDFEIAVKFSAALVELARKGSAERPNHHGKCQ